MHSYSIVIIVNIIAVAAASNGSSNDFVLAASHPVNTPIHHHQVFNINIMNVTTEPSPIKPENFLTDADYSSSKLLKIFYLSHVIPCDILSDPLYQHATDFMRLVDVKTLTPVLLQYNLLTPDDNEFLLLPTYTDGDKKSFIHVRLLRLGKEGYEKFIACLNDPYALQHPGHQELHEKLSTSQE